MLMEVSTHAGFAIENRNPAGSTIGTPYDIYSPTETYENMEVKPKFDFHLLNDRLTVNVTCRSKDIRSIGREKMGKLLHSNGYITEDEFPYGTPTIMHEKLIDLGNSNYHYTLTLGLPEKENKFFSYGRKKIKNKKPNKFLYIVAFSVVILLSKHIE